MGASRNVIAPRSIESKNHAVAITRNRDRCTLDQGRRSSRPAIAAGELAGRGSAPLDIDALVSLDMGLLDVGVLSGPRCTPSRIE